MDLLTTRDVRPYMVSLPLENALNPTFKSSQRKINDPHNGHPLERWTYLVRWCRVTAVSQDGDGQALLPHVLLLSPHIL